MFEKKIKKYNFKKKYSIDDSIKIIKDITTVKFNSSIDLTINLKDINFKKYQQINNFIFLSGLGKKIKILALCNSHEELKCKNAGANYAGFDKYIKKIKNGWLDFDIIVTTPSLMLKLNAIKKKLNFKKKCLILKQEI